MLRLTFFSLILCFFSCNNAPDSQQPKEQQAPVRKSQKEQPATSGYTSIWEKDIQAFEAADKLHPPAENGIVFIGSSSIRLWESLEEDMAPLPVIQRGFGGSKIADAVHYADRIVTNYKPKIVVIFSGTNDLTGSDTDKEPREILADYTEFTTKVKNKLPEVLIYYISMTPAESRWHKLEEVKQTNTLIKQFSAGNEKLFFFDLQNQFISKEGGPRKELFMEDGLHLNKGGYRLWTDAMKPVLVAAYNR